MKRKILSVVLVLATLCAVLSLTACLGGKQESADNTRMTVDVNPSIEFMLDKDNKVVSVTALNDDASVLIVGESFVGKTHEEAVELVVSLATEMGYLVKGEAELAENAVKISVSGDSEVARKLYDDVRARAESVLAELDVNATVRQIDAMGKAALAELVAAASGVSTEELGEMTEEELYAALAARRTETAELLTAELRDVYTAARDARISFTESEEIGEIIGSLGGLYGIVQTTYNTALEGLGEASDALEELRYSLLVSPESEYQKALSELRTAKLELLEQRSELAKLEQGTPAYEAASLALTAKENAYALAESALEAAAAAAETSIAALRTALAQAETALKQLESTLFDDSIREKLAEKASELEGKLNAAKDGFFESFESEHAADLEAIRTELLARKEALKSAIAE